MSQAAFNFDLRIVPVERVAEETPGQRFVRFHNLNPHVYRWLVAEARKVKAMGKRCGMRLLWERLRWVQFIETDGDEYKLNNVLAPFYSRLIMQQEADLAGFFETRGDAA